MKERNNWRHNQKRKEEDTVCMMYFHVHLRNILDHRRNSQMYEFDWSMFQRSTMNNLCFQSESNCQLDTEHTTFYCRLMQRNQLDMLHKQFLVEIDNTLGSMQYNCLSQIPQNTNQGDTVHNKRHLLMSSIQGRNSCKKQHYHLQMFQLCTPYIQKNDLPVYSTQLGNLNKNWSSYVVDKFPGSKQYRNQLLTQKNNPQDTQYILWHELQKSSQDHK